MERRTHSSARERSKPSSSKLYGLTEKLILLVKIGLCRVTVIVPAINPLKTSQFQPRTPPAA